MKYILSIIALLASNAFAAMALNPDVTQATIDQTICVAGYTKTVRPSVSYTNGVKRKLLRQQGIPASDAGLYELDHAVPLTLGGHPRALGNLVLQSWDGPAGAKVKDKLEPKLSRLVCARKIRLAEAQACIYHDWQACAKKYAKVK